jgi:3-oxocholest-4-en-26-oyl-CoA dehydrogenase alpha subunit
MRYDYTPEQQAWRDEVRRFLRQAVTPALVAEMRQAGNEGDGPLARAFHRRLFDKGWWGIGWPKEFGGMGKSAVEQYIFGDEMALAGAPAMRLAITSVAPTILRTGTEEQKQRWLPPIVKGEIDFAVAYSEPDAGTDLAALKTRAVLDGDDWVINGQKIWNTGAHAASHNWVAVRTEPDAPKHKGISMLIVPMDRPGITVQPLWTWSGIRTNAVFFEDVRVPRDHLIGERGMGFYYAMMALDFERVMIGSTGMLRRLLDELVVFVRRTRRDGRPLGTIPWVRRALADLEMRVEVGSRIGVLNAWLIDQGEVPTKEGSIAKVYVTELNARLASAGMDILGLAGQLAPDDPAAPLHGRLQWLYTIAPLQRFGGGTNEIQRMIIAQRGLGLPRK